MIATRLDCNGRALILDQPRICGVVNVTPDSFSDGGVSLDTQTAIERGVRLVSEGADLLDVGGESTRPGAEAVDVVEELARIVPVIEGLARHVAVPISVDTSKPEVMRAAVAAGAGLINDVYALRHEGAAEAAASLGVPVCLMHMQGEPRSMQEAPNYEDVVGEIHRFLAERTFACEMAGIERRNILVDPGFGFGKNLQHNLTLLRDLGRFVELSPVMVGLSRKSMIGTLTGHGRADQRVTGSAVAAVLAVQRGARIVRVHDVAATRDALAVWNALDAITPALSRDVSRPVSSRWDDD